MNTQTLHDKLRLAAHIVEHNLAWEYAFSPSLCWEPSNKQDLQTVISFPTANIRLTNGWLPHYGGDCPTETDTNVNWLTRGGKNADNVVKRAEQLIWRIDGDYHDIIAWRPAQPEPFDIRAHVEQSFHGLREAHVFHRNDFTADDLPPGYRPLLLGERGGCEILHRGSWVCDNGLTPAQTLEAKQRTTRPLPVLGPQEIADGWIEWHGGECPVEPYSRPQYLQRNGALQLSGAEDAKRLRWSQHATFYVDIIAYKPDPYGKLRQALADGKTVEWNIREDEWLPDANPNWALPPDRYRIALEKKRVPLGPEDVPPGSVFRPRDWPGNIYVTPSVFLLGITYSSNNTCVPVSFSDLQEEEWLINRPKHRDADGYPTLWEPCYKEVEV